MSGKERKRYRVMQTEYSNYGITQCMFVVVTFSEDKENENNGFHPNQVDSFYLNK